MWLPWRDAVVVAGALGAYGTVAPRIATVGARRPRVRASAGLAREAALVFALYALWQYAGTISVMGAEGAMRRGEAIWHAERFLHLPSEVALQRIGFHSDTLMRGANLYYLVAHVPAVIAFLVWMFFRHRDQYPRWRNVLAAVTATSLAIQLVPVAPPRMYPGLGFVDAAQRYGQSVYSALGHSGADQLSAMPSVHVAWALIVGIGVVAVSRRRRRWLALGHPIATVFVVTVSANHWWLDGAVAAILLAIALLAESPVADGLAALRGLFHGDAPVGGPTRGKLSGDTAV
ncbi:MAG: phosphatase PAP2 family protein [Acidimicrobiia bacterium]